MHNLQMYENLRDMLEREVKQLSNKNDLDAQGYDHLYKVMSALKNVNKCIEEESMEGASYEGRGRSRASYGMSNNYSRMMPYSMDNMSYGRDGDGDGRYNESRDNFRNRSYRGQSYEGSYGYSRDNARQKMVSKLETLMDDTMSDRERDAIMDCIDKIK